MKRLFPIQLLALAVLSSVVLPAGGESGYELTRWTIDGGGASPSAGDGYELRSTIGQPEFGTVLGDGFELCAGFWHPVSPADCIEDGYVDLADYLSLEQCVSSPAVPVSEGCECFDVDRNGFVDLLDFAALQVYFNGR
jgi:hypothetical protein